MTEQQYREHAAEMERLRVEFKNQWFLNATPSVRYSFPAMQNAWMQFKADHINRKQQTKTEQTKG